MLLEGRKEDYMERSEMHGHFSPPPLHPIVTNEEQTSILLMSTALLTHTTRKRGMKKRQKRAVWRGRAGLERESRVGEQFRSEISGALTTPGGSLHQQHSSTG